MPKEQLPQETPRKTPLVLVKKTFSPNTLAIWLFLALIAALDACSAKALGMDVLASNMFLTKSIVCLLLAAIVCKYLLRLDLPAQAAHMAAVICAFLPLAYITSYLAVAAHYPLIDGPLAAADRALGLDWLADYQWVIAHPRVYAILAKVYAGIGLQFVVLLLLFFWRRQYDRGWELIRLSMLCCMVCILVSTFWPAAGAFHYYGVRKNSSYVRTFMALYQGHIKIIGNRLLEGIIQFPSFHAMMAVVLVYATRGFKLISIGYILLNIVTIISMPYIGGHHYADILAGLPLALGTILAERYISTRCLNQTIK